MPSDSSARAVRPDDHNIKAREVPAMTTATATAEHVMMRPRRLGHANLFVGDLERSIAFYNKICGLELVRREPGIGAGFLSAGTTHHDVGLMQASGEQRVGLGGHVQVATGRGTRAGLNHFGWEMESEAELVAAYKRAVAAGFVDLRTANHQISHSVYMADPDGNHNEFYADALKDWRSIFNPHDESLVTGHWDPLSGPPSEDKNYATAPEIRRVDGAIFHPVRITHAIMVARDFDRMREFYQHVAGLKPIDEEAGRFVTMRAAAGEFDLALVAGHGKLKPGLFLMSYQLTDEDDLGRCESALRAADIPIASVIDLPSKRGIVIPDPDGMSVEFYRRTGKERQSAKVDVQPYLQ
jgi:catechol 2,3-dioxygenase